jgi:predicted dehydrogenase
MPERFLIVGLGSIGSRHARIARMLMPGTRTAVLRHRGCKRLQDARIDCCFTSLEEAIRFAPQAAVIANPASHHLEVALPLAQAGTHLLVEKPISASPEGVPELIRTCQANGLVLMMGYNLRFLSTLQRFRQLLDSGVIGRVFSVRAEVGLHLPAWRAGVDYRQTVSAKATLGGGVLLELSHEIDYLRWLFGNVQWVGAALRTQSDLEIDVEDTALLTLGFAGKNGAQPLIASLNMDFVRQDNTRFCIAIGESGTLRWNAILGTVKVFKKGESSWRTLFAHPPQRDESYLAEWNHFLDCVRRGTPPMISGEDGLAVLKVVQAARLSSEKRAVVEVG